MTPMAQAIWGNYLIGYKTPFDAVLSVFMIAYSKGNLEELLQQGAVIYSMLFILIYYVFLLFFLHAAFHNA